MNSLANGLFRVLFGWFQGLVSSVWTALTTGGETFVSWTGNHWKIIALTICIIGLLTDLIIYLLRWRPYLVWRSFLRGRKNRADEDSREVGMEEEEEWDADAAPATDRAERSYFRTNSPDRSPTADEQYSAYDEESDDHATEDKEYAPDDGYDRSVNTEEAERALYSHRKRNGIRRLFRDREDELADTVGPEELINSSKAYHDPVYPKSWRRQETHND